MWAYFDTSALIKRYIKETGRREVLQLLRRYDVVTSVIVPVELRSALRRRASEGTLDAERVPEVLKRVATDRAYWTLVEITSDVLMAAETLVAAGAAGVGWWISALLRSRRRIGPAATPPVGR